MEDEVTISRIKEAAKQHWLTVKGENAWLDFEAGAKYEAEQSKVLYDCLKLIRKDMPEGSWFAKTIDKAISKYDNEPKKKTNDRASNSRSNIRKGRVGN